jgi:hypothetical protein
MYFTLRLSRGQLRLSIIPSHVSLRTSSAIFSSDRIQIMIVPPPLWRGIRCPDKFFDQLHIDRTICGRENSGGIVEKVTDGNYAMSDAIMELVHFPMERASELNHSSQLGMRWLTTFDRRYTSRKEASLPLE